ncbi:MAG: tRNA (N(6)-L-threonylcarbamoyladenosine(37)-C(2))-methylthiotransferase MtaB [Ndongobacter sp.]|nr:tRNA (N(6)-L-threonylcarbamoyladenosine(37)-C(2))-methylthiotransferase MtaB [Ndongobacter sp.]
MKRFSIRTLGCKVNQYETEAMEELFLRRGYVRAEDERSDVFVVNTCTVTSLSDGKCRQQIHRVKRQNPDAIVAVVGCYSQVSPEEIQKIDGVDIILGTKGRAEIVDLVEQFERQRQPILRVGELTGQRFFDELSIETQLSMTRAYIKIQEGCEMFCTYCIIPHARGKIASRELAQIGDEANRLAGKGFREVVLTGIHVASYGKDWKNGIGLIDAIERVAAIPAIERIRLSSIEPRWVDGERLRRMKATGKVCGHFHLSLQSGSDAVLHAMNRRYTTDLYREKIALIRSVFPDAGITTDVIVGFPGESEEHFEQTMGFCRETQFSKIHIFPYSPRKGTPAADFPDQVSGPVKKQRAHRLGELEEQMRFAFLDRHIGRTVNVLFEELSGDAETMLGYTENYMRVRVPRRIDDLNRVRQVFLTSREEGILCGRLLNEEAE